MVDKLQESFDRSHLLAIIQLNQSFIQLIYHCFHASLKLFIINKYYFLMEKQPNNQLGYEYQKKVKGEKLRKVKEEEMKGGCYRWIGALTFQVRRGQVGKGTAVLIANDLILTVAHNIYNKEQKTLHSKFKFYLAPCGIVEDYYQVEEGAWRYPIQFQTCTIDDRSSHEYGILKLKKAYKGQRKFMPLSLTCRSCHGPDFEDIKLGIYGYPNDDCSNYTPHDEDETQIQLYQYGLTKTGYVHSLEPPGCVTYSISTLPGQSGCPIVCNNQIIGLHFGAGKSTQFTNMGKLITTQVLERLNQWKEELKADSFLINQERFCNCSPSRMLLSKIQEPSNIVEKAKSIPQPKSEEKIQFSKTESKSEPVAQLLPKDLLAFNEIQPQQSNNPAEIQSILLDKMEAQEIKITQKGIQSINVTSHLKLKELDLDNNYLERINVRNNKWLNYLSLRNNQIKSLDVRANICLVRLYLSWNKLTEINLQENNDLQRLWLTSNQFTTIDLSSNTKLSHLDLTSNQFEAVDLRSNTQLIEIDLRSNILAAIDLRQNINLIKLILRNNKITKIDLSKNVNLAELDLESNKLKEVNLSANVNLLKLRLNSNQLTSVDLKANKRLTHFNLFSNQVADIDLQSNTQLTDLDLSWNKFTKIDLRTNTNLVEIDFRANELRIIDIRENSKLQKINFRKNIVEIAICCWHSQLKKIDMSSQRSASCELFLLHQKKDEQACRKWGEAEIKGYNEAEKGKDPNEHGCEYRLQLQEKA